MRALNTEILIEAAPRTLWSVLTDFAAYPEWNPFIVQVQGRPIPDSRLRVRLQPPGGRPMTFRPRVLRVEPDRELRWLGHVLVSGLFDGEHILRLEPVEGGTRFVQREEFRGLLLPLLWRGLDTKTRAGFEAMNMSLKNRAEVMTQR